MRVGGFVLLFLVLTSLEGIRAEDAGRNLLKNPGFESGDRVPEGWRFNQRRSDSHIVWDRRRSHIGDASVVISTRSRGETGNVLQSVTFDKPLEPGSRVGFSAMAACEDLTRDGPRIIITLHSDDGGRQSASAVGIGGTHDFVKVRGHVVTDARTKRIIIYLCNYGVGKTWWDDAQIEVNRAPATKMVARPRATRAVATLRTADGLGLTLADSGTVSGVALDDRSLALSSAGSGLWLRPYHSNTIPVTGKLTFESQRVRQSFDDVKSGLRVDAEFYAQSDTITCRGVVEDTTGEDRGVEVFFGLPIGGSGWRWGKSIRAEMPLDTGPQALKVTTFSSVSNPATGEGVALAVPADTPCDCWFTYDDELGYSVRFRFGLSLAASGRLRSKAPFRFVIYRCKGAWGLRDAARRYYELWPDAFEKRVSREGLWMFGNPRIQLPDPQNYAFHEGGPGGWQYDDAHRIYTCPYIIPGQREITRLAKLPADRQEAMEIFREYRQRSSGVVKDRPGVTLREASDTTSDRPSGWGRDMADIIERCMLQDADGLPHIRIRNTTWGGNSITFPLNASPRLFEEIDHVTVAKALRGHVKRLHEDIPSLDGTYVDSLGSWGSYLNHRREHFRYSQIPLSYDPTSGQPVIPNRFSLLEFLWELRDQMHGRGKLLFANGVHPDRRFHFFALDILGVEGHGALEQKRVMAYQKPFLLLIYNIHDKPAEMERYYHLCTLYGIYPSFANMRVYETPEMYASVAAINERFVPALQTITAAGWRPIPHARCTQADVWLERWGPDDRGRVYLTVYNAAQKAQPARLTIDTEPLRLTDRVKAVEDLLSGDHWNTSTDNNTAVLDVPMPPEQCRVLQLSSVP